MPGRHAIEGEYIPRQPSGRRILPANCGATGGNNQPVGDGTLWAVAILLNPGTTASMRVQVNTAAVAPSALRLGIYNNDTAADYPGGSLLVDAGTVDPTVTGEKILTTSTVIPKAGLYWAVVAHQGAGTAPFIDGFTSTYRVPIINPFSWGAHATRATYIFTGITGALPTNLPAIANLGGSVTTGATNPTIAVMMA